MKTTKSRTWRRFFIFSDYHNNSMQQAIFAVDVSGSVKGQSFYHEKCAELSRSLVNGGYKEVKFTVWDTKLVVVTESRLAQINAEKGGWGGTEPSVIADALVDVYDVHLVILTDGCVRESDVAVCDARMRRVLFGAFSSVDVYVVGDSANLSVSCPFTRRCPHRVFTFTSRGVPIETSEVSFADVSTLECIGSIRTSAELLAAVPSLERAIRARTMGVAGDTELADRLIAMRKRVARSAVSADTTAAVRSDTALHDIQRIRQDYYSGADVSLDARVSRLLAMCHGAMRNTFSVSDVRTNAMRRADVAPDVAFDVEEDCDGFALVPVAMCTTNDAVVLVVNETPLLAGRDLDLLSRVTACPLSALNDPDLSDSIRGAVDCGVSLESFHASSSQSTSPYTRRRVLPLPLGCSDEHVRACDRTIALVLNAEGKLLGNADLWFAVFLACSTRIPDDVQEQMREQMRFRMRTHATAASLSGLSAQVSTKVPLEVALFFCVASCATPIRPSAAEDPLRMHVYNAGHMKALLDIAGVTVPPSVSMHHARLRVVFNMLSWVKRDERGFRDAMRALVHASVPSRPDMVMDAVRKREKYVPSRYYFIDGVPGGDAVSTALAELPSTYRLFSPAEVYALSHLVARDRAAADVDLTVDYFPPPIVPPTPQWAYTEPVFADVEIAADTLRPRAVLEDGRSWRQAAETFYGVPVSEILSANKRYAGFVRKYTAYPDAESFLAYLYNREVVCGRRNALPSNICDAVEHTLYEYRNVRAETTPEEFVKRAF